MCRSRFLVLGILIAGLGCGAVETPSIENPPKAEDGPSNEAPSDARMTIEVPTDVRLIQGVPARVLVKVMRTGSPSTVEVAVGDLPVGVTSRPVVVDANQETASIELEASTDSLQGARAAVVVTAKAGTFSTTASLNIRVTGAPGSRDLSYGDRGEVDVEPPGLESTANVEVSALAVAPSGEAFVVYDGTTVTKIDADGALDRTFGASGRIEPALLTDWVCTDFFVPCILLTPDSKVVLQDEYHVLRFGGDGARDLSFGTAGRITWPLTSKRTSSTSVLVEGASHLVVAGVGDTGHPLLDRLAPEGTRDPRFDTTAAFGCSPSALAETCSQPLAVAAQADGGVLYAGYRPADSQSLEVRLFGFSTAGEKQFMSSVLFKSEWRSTLFDGVFFVRAVADYAVVLGLDTERRLTAASVDSTGATIAARRLDIEATPSMTCDDFALFPADSGEATVSCVSNATGELRLLRLTRSLDRDVSFGTAGVATGSGKAGSARVARGPGDTILVAAGKKLLRLWN